MKIVLSRRHTCSGQVMAEACIGLSLMVFTWILLTFSLFMANNHIRTAMAARHAAWYRGAALKEATATQIDDWFFFQTGLSKVEYKPGLGFGDVLGAGSEDAQKYSKDSNGPFISTVKFGVDDINTTTQFPFDLLKTRVPFMTDFIMKDKSGNTVGLSVQSSCQWDEVGDPWKSLTKALEEIASLLKDQIAGILKKLI